MYVSSGKADIFSGGGWNFSQSVTKTARLRKMEAMQGKTAFNNNDVLNQWITSVIEAKSYF